MADVKTGGYNFREAEADKVNRGELRRIEVSPAENGFVVRCWYEPKNPRGPEPDSPQYVFDSAEKASEHVEMMLSKHATYEEKEK